MAKNIINVSYFYFVGISRFRLSLVSALGFMVIIAGLRKKGFGGHEFEAEGPRGESDSTRRAKSVRISLSLVIRAEAQWPATSLQSG